MVDNQEQLDRIEKKLDELDKKLDKHIVLIIIVLCLFIASVA